MTTTRDRIDRAAAARAMAKAAAYMDCGRYDDAERWTLELLHILGMAHLTDGPVMR